MSSNAPTLPAVAGYGNEGKFTIADPFRQPASAMEQTPAVDWIRHREASLQTSYRDQPAPSSSSALASLAETYALQALPNGWNGYDAAAPTPSTVYHALNWLQRFYVECTREGQAWDRPNVAASAEGEVVYEWWADDRTLTVYVEEDAVEYMKFGRGEGSTLREHGSAEDPRACVGLMHWFSE